MSDIIYEDKDRRIVIEHSTAYSRPFVALLERTVWGTNVLYNRRFVAETLDRVLEPHFLSLRKDGELVAVFALSRKITRVGKIVYPAFYLFDQAVAASRTGQGYGLLLASVLRSHFLEEVGSGGMMYGYIEAENVPSLRVAQEAGHQTVGLCSAVVFTRLRPRNNARVERLGEGEKEAVVQLLNDQYADHALLDFEQSVRADEYYVFRQAGEVAAGAQAVPQTCVIRALPGIGERLLVHVLPHIPILRAAFDARDFRFLRFGNVYARAGCEDAAFTVMESVLARYHCNLGLLLLDKRSPDYQRLVDTGRLGLSRVTSDVAVHVIASFNGVSEAQIAEIRGRPLCISMMDVI